MSPRMDRHDLSPCLAHTHDHVAGRPLLQPSSSNAVRPVEHARSRQVAAAGGVASFGRSAVTIADRTRWTARAWRSSWPPAAPVTTDEGSAGDHEQRDAVRDPVRRLSTSDELVDHLVGELEAQDGLQFLAGTPTPTGPHVHTRRTTLPPPGILLIGIDDRGARRRQRQQLAELAPPSLWTAMKVQPERKTRPTSSRRASALRPNR